MTNVQGDSQRTSAKTDFDAVIIGAGFSGMYMLHSLRDKLDLNVTVFEAGDGVGGTWYWNRYPGARCDSDSYIYCYTFDKNLLQEWNWSERYPEQDEILRYLEHCAERFDLKPDIQFGKRVVEVVFDDNTELWTVRTDKGDIVRAHFVITAVGALSTANMPPIKGLSSFTGKCYHTSQWPHDGVDFTAKRVGVIGTGATAVQAIPEIAQQAKHLTVFQRTPNFCVPAQRPRRSRGDQGAQGRLRRDPPAYKGLVLRLRAEFHTEVGARDNAGGARAAVRQDVGRRRLRVLAGQLPGHVFLQGGERCHCRLPQAQDPLDRQRPGDRREADPQDLPLRHQAPATGHQLL